MNLRDTVLVGTLVSAARAGTPVVVAARKFFLTKTSFPGSQALTACGTGFHMASLWEIFNVSTVVYKPNKGLTQDDSGSGPPAYVTGWIRTGFYAVTDSSVGTANCSAWSSGAASDYGTEVWLAPDWDSSGVILVSPWKAAVASCDTIQPVWCVSNR